MLIFSNPSFSKGWKFWEKENPKRDYGKIRTERNLLDNKLVKLANEILIDEKHQSATEEYHIRLHVFPNVHPVFIIVKLYYDEMYDPEPETINWIHEGERFSAPFTDRHLNKTLEELSQNDNPSLAYDRVVKNQRQIVLEYAFNKNQVLGIPEVQAPSIGANGELLEREIKDEPKKKEKKSFSWSKKNKKEEKNTKEVLEVIWKSGAKLHINITEKLYSTAEFIRPEIYPHQEDEEIKEQIQNEFFNDPSQDIESPVEPIL